VLLAVLLENMLAELLVAGMDQHSAAVKVCSLADQLAVDLED
jgi:hypothetical protein